MKIRITILLMVVFAMTTNAQVIIGHEQPSDAPKREIRAVWLTTLMNLDWPRTRATSTSSIERQKAELCRILDDYQKANINTVLFQTVVRATTVYPSSILPWDQCMTGRYGRNPGYDPLAFAISECHKRGMEIQAWMVTLPVGADNSYGARRLKRQGYKLMHFGGSAYLDPSSDRNVDLLASVAREITTHYDIDGIHLDYIRYPETMPRPRNEYIANWRRSKITNVVRRISNAIKAEKPWVKLSCSPIGKYSDLTRFSSNNWNARDRVSQDAQLWLRYGLMDQLYPMMYFRGNNFYPFAADWAENKHGKAIAAGLGTYFLNAREGGRYGWTAMDIRREMMVSRRLGLGTAHFRSRFFTDNEQDIYDFSQYGYAPYPSLIPESESKGNGSVEAPKAIMISDGKLYINGSNNQYYNIYASGSWPVDIADARNLMLARHKGNIVEINVSASWHPRYYAVTAMDRYGRESSAVQSWSGPSWAKGELKCIDGIIDIDQYVKPDNNILYFEVRTLQGSVVMRVRPQKSAGKTVLSLRTLPIGTYCLFSISKVFKKRKTAQRIGLFRQED